MIGAVRAKNAVSPSEETARHIPTRVDLKLRILEVLAEGVSVIDRALIARGTIDGRCHSYV